MNVKHRLALALVAALLFCSGCIESHAIDQYGYVVGIGFDRGAALPYNVTLVLQQAGGGENAQEGGSEGFRIVSAECRSLFEAIDTLSANVPFQLNFMRTKIIVFSARLAGEPGEMESLLDFSLDRLHIRRNVNLYVSLSAAREALEGLENEFDLDLTKIQANFVRYANETGLTTVTNASNYFESAQNGLADAMLPLCGVADEKAERWPQDSVDARAYAYIGGGLLVENGMQTGLAGAALFSGGTMAGFLDGQHTQLVRIATGDFARGRMLLVGPAGENLSVSLKQISKPQRRLTLGGGSAYAETQIFLQADIEHPAAAAAGMPADQLEQHIAAQIEAEYAALFRACQSLNSDVFGFGELAVMKFSSVSDWEAYDWRAAYRGMDAAFFVRVELVPIAGTMATE